MGKQSYLMMVIINTVYVCCEYNCLNQVEHKDERHKRFPVYVFPRKPAKHPMSDDRTIAYRL